VEMGNTPGGPTARRLLIVEDDPAAAELLAAAAREAGCEPLVAGDGGTALRLARERQPALVLLDLRLPGMGGAAVLRALKLDPETTAIPVLVVSGMAHQIAPIYLDGAAAVLPKPVDVGELAALLGRLLASAPC
jgi:CheY-like chemotaxis protein